MVWLRLEGVKAQGAAGGRALFTLKGSTPEGPKGVSAAFKGAWFFSLGQSCARHESEVLRHVR